MTKRKSEDFVEDESNKRPGKSVGMNRLISACQRCRSKKIRCDQQLPKCTKCVAAGAECIGLDPATGREVPRSYVCHLEDRVAELENMLKHIGHNPNSDMIEAPQSVPKRKNSEKGTPNNSSTSDSHPEKSNGPTQQRVYAGTASSISFAKLMHTALRVKRMNSTSPGPSLELPTQKETISLAILPPKQTAIDFLKIYFEQSNSQMPILHREEFLKNYFLPIYGNLDRYASFASIYSELNQSMIIDPNLRVEDTWFHSYKIQFQKLMNAGKDATQISELIKAPVRFHKALFFLNMVFAISSSVNLLLYPPNISFSFHEAAKKSSEAVYFSGDHLEALLATLLEALYATMRPSLPQVWYILGNALRVCVDLNLHDENSRTWKNLDFATKDKRRRLLWCTISLDRQICFYLNRPVGISRDSISTKLPSVLDDSLIVAGTSAETDSTLIELPSYKSISIAFFKIRLIQYEVQKILYSDAELPRRFQSFADWTADIERQLTDWKNSCPRSSRKMNCEFNMVFFTLNYNHTLLALHGLSPKHYKLSFYDLRIVSESAKEVITCYTQLYNTKSINYTWAAVNNLFMAGTSYIHTIYINEEIRRMNSIYEVKQISSECLTVLGSLIGICDAALDCRDIFENLTMVVIKLKYNEMVHGYSTKSLKERLSKIENGNLNSNITLLVDNLNHDETVEKSTEHIQSLASTSPNDELESAIQKTLEPYKEENNFQSVVFEWISDPAARDPSSVEISQFDSNMFLDEVQNLTPNSSISNEQYHTLSNSYEEGPRSDNLSPTLSSNVYLDRHSSSFPMRQGDGKELYDLIQQTSVDSIWDQFFTGSGAA